MSQKQWLESCVRAPCNVRGFAHDLNVNLFETTIRHLGGLLSAFAPPDRSFGEPRAKRSSVELRLSGRPGLLAKAVDLGDRLWLTCTLSLCKAQPELSWKRPKQGSKPFPACRQSVVHRRLRKAPGLCSFLLHFVSAFFLLSSVQRRQVTPPPDGQTTSRSCCNRLVCHKIRWTRCLGRSASDNSFS